MRVESAGDIRCLRIFIANALQENGWPWKLRSRSWSTAFAMFPFDGKHQPLQSHTLEHFFASFHRYSHFKICDREIVIKIMTYNIRSGAIRWQTPDFLSVGNGNVCIFPAFTSQISYSKSLTLKIWVSSVSKAFAKVPFDGKYQPLWKS